MHPLLKTGRMSERERMTTGSENKEELNNRRKEGKERESDIRAGKGVGVSTLHALLDSLCSL